MFRRLFTVLSALSLSAAERRSVMQQEKTSSSTATRTWWPEVSKPARAAFVCGIPIAIGLAAWDAADDSLGPEHPLSVTRLALRLGSLSASAVSIAIASIGAFRAWRWTTRLRTGLCPRCGYDLRESPEKCPECGAVRAEQTQGAPAAAAPAGGGEVSCPRRSPTA